MAKKNAAAGADKGDNNEILLLVGFVGVAYILWTAFHAKFAAMILAIRTLQAKPIALFTSKLDEIIQWMKLINRSDVTIGDLWQVSSNVGFYYTFIYTPVLLYLGYKLFRSSPTERFRRKFTDVTLPKAEADLYPWMRISVKLDFPSMDTEKGNWAMAKTERQFVRMHKLRNPNGELDIERTEAVLVKQLGPLYMGHKAMKPHARALYALFLVRMEKDFKKGDAYLMHLALSASNGKLDISGADEIIEKYSKSKKLKKLEKQHAYESTLLMSMLEEARGGPRGKDYLPPNWFLWLKGMDRRLWYPLADVGRETPHAECIGVWGHWLAERALGNRLEMPFVKNAAEGLALELAKYTNDDEEEEGFGEDEELLVPDEYDEKGVRLPATQPKLDDQKK